MSETQALAYWMGPDKEPFVAEENGVILGSTTFGQIRLVGAACVQLRLYDPYRSYRAGNCTAHVRAFARVRPIPWLSSDAVQLCDQYE